MTVFSSESIASPIVSSILGPIGQGAIGLSATTAISQPAYNAVVHKQLAPNSTYLNVFKQMVKSQQGIKALYRGVIPKTVGVTLKNSYRPYLGTRFKHQMEKRLPPFPLLSTILTSLFMAVFETAVVLPATRIETYVVTRDVPKHAVLRFFREQSSKKALVKNFYVGVAPYGARKAVSWTSFLVTPEVAKQALLRLTGKESLSNFDMLPISLFVGVVNTTCTMPFLYLQTQAQQAKSQQVAKTGLKADVRLFYQHLTGAFKKPQGPRHLWAGWWSYLFFYTMQALPTLGIWNAMEKR